MFCTKCSAEMLEGDIFCPRCGAPQKIRNGSGINEDTIRKTASTVDVIPDCEEVSPENREYIGQHRKYGDELKETYSGYYESVENTKKKKASGCFIRVLLVAFFALLIIVVLLCGILLIRGENPIDHAKQLWLSITSSSDLSGTASESITITDLTSSSDHAGSTSSVTTTTTTTVTTTTMFTTKKPTTTTRKTTTTTKPTTTTTPVGKLVRETSVGNWTADISALNISVAGSKVKTINISIDKNGNANVSFKLGFITVKTSGSFTVQNDGRTDLTIKVPYSSDIIQVVGYSKVENNNRIIFRCSEGDITLNRK